MRRLMWFRTDLRAADNPALHAATREPGAAVIGLYVISPEEWARHDWAPVKVEFTLRTLRALRETLATRTIPLVIEHAARAGDVPGVVAGAAKRLACGEVFANIEHEVDEKRRDERTRIACESQGVAFRPTHDQTIIPPDALRTKAGGYYTVFTPFKRAWLAGLEARGGASEPLPPARKQEPTGIEPSPTPERVEGFDSPIDPSLWPAGERAAARALAKFIESRARAYAGARDAPAADGTSRLSPHLTVGAISARQCLWAIGEAFGRGVIESTRASDAGASTWVSELIWREFYRHVLVAFPRVCMGRPFKTSTERIRWREDPEALQAWASGRTGFPIVDAGMRELATTGWMHNRVRMIVAMFLSKDLLLDWRLGERHFMRHLIDGDFASNNGGWQWSASTGTDAAPYFRVFNPTSQSRKVDPDGAYIRRFVPELAHVEGDAIHDPSLLPPLLRAGLDYPAPIVDHAFARERAISAFRDAGAEVTRG